MRLFAGTQFDIPPTCDRCQKLEEECDCPPIEEPKVYLPPEKQKAIVSVEKRKKGKLVTVVSGLKADENDFATMLTNFKNRCGAGGTIKADQIEIQGNHCESIVTDLKKAGYKVTSRG